MQKSTAELQKDVWEKRFGGNGEIRVTHLLDKERMGGKGRLYSRMLLKPGCSLGYHQHNGETETYYILSGEGTMNDNGQTTTVKAGDVIFTADGEFHSIENTGSADLEFIALILFV